MSVWIPSGHRTHDGQPDCDVRWCECSGRCTSNAPCDCCELADLRVEVERLTASNEVLTFVAVKAGQASQQAWARIKAALAFCEQQAKDRSPYSDDLRCGAPRGRIRHVRDGSGRQRWTFPATLGGSASRVLLLNAVDKARTISTPTDPWDCPQGCGVEYGHWCEHLTPDARCPAINEQMQQCSLCAGHQPDTTWGAPSWDTSSCGALDCLALGASFFITVGSFGGYDRRPGGRLPTSARPSHPATTTHLTPTGTRRASGSSWPCWRSVCWRWSSHCWPRYGGTASERLHVPTLAADTVRT